MGNSSLAKAKELLEKLDLEMGATEGDRVTGWATLAVAEQVGRVASQLQALDASLHNLGVGIGALKRKGAF